MYANEQRHRCCVFFEYEWIRILCSEFQQMKLKKRNTDGVEKGISNDDISFSL